MRKGWLGPIRIAGVEVYLHVLLLVLPGMILASSKGEREAPLRFGLLAVVLASVLLHELGHAFVAKARGLRVYDVRLHLLGGAARIERRLPLSWNPKDEVVVSLAGPVVNLAIAAVLLIAGLTAHRVLPGFELSGWTNSLWASAIATNALMGGLNLLPAFPADGGRVFRALLAYRTSYLTATRVALVGTALGVVGVIAWGLAGETRSGLLLSVATAAYLVLGAQREWAWAKTRRQIEIFRAFARASEGRWPAIGALPKDVEGQPYPSPGLFDDPELTADFAVFQSTAGRGERYLPR